MKRSKNQEQELRNMLKGQTYTRPIVITVDDSVPEGADKGKLQDKRTTKSGSSKVRSFSRSIYIDSHDITADDISHLFESSLMHEFVQFVSAGLPQVFLKSKAHEHLTVDENVATIRQAIEQVPDPDLKKYLLSRLRIIESSKSSKV